MLPSISGLPVPGSTALWTLSQTRICFLFSWKINNSLGPAAAFWENREHQQEIKMSDTQLTTCKKGKSPLLWAFNLLIPTWVTVSFLFSDSNMRHLSLSLWGVALLFSSQVGGMVALARGLWIIINGCLAVQLRKAFSAPPSITEPPATLSLRLLPSPCGYYLTFPFRSNSSNLSPWLPGSIPINPCQQLRSR